MAAAGLVLLLAPVAAGPARAADLLSDLLLPESQEKQLAEQEHPKILQAFGGEYRDPELARYVGSLASFLGATSQRPDRQYRVTILNSPVVNAFALPAGYLYITRGLLALAGNEAELAGVLAHEIGHVTARHVAERYSRTILTQGIVGILGAVTQGSELAGLGELAAPVAFSVLQGFSREQEHAADQLGVATMARAGYDPRAMSSFLVKLQANDKLQAALSDQPDTSGQLDLFATHPRTVDRVNRTVQAAAFKPVRDPMTEQEIYLGKIDGLLYGDDPEQGFVRGLVFAHPSLNIRFEVPPDFHLLNGQIQVAAKGPAGAGIQFDLAPERPTLGPLRYLTEVWAKDRVLAELERITVNGFPGATGTLHLEGTKGAADLRYIAIEVERGTIYRFLFVTPPELTQRLAPDLRRTTYSFRRLSAAERRALKPYGLTIITAQQGETAQGLAARTPFADHQVERFRVLNGLGPTEEPRAGARVKLVVEQR
jgi:predicted Zn-dependent protease